MTNNEVYARRVAYLYECAKKYESDIYWKLVDHDLQELCFDKFNPDLKYDGVESSDLVSTDEVVSWLCRLGKVEFVGYALDYFDKHGRHFDPDMNL